MSTDIIAGSGARPRPFHISEIEQQLRAQLQPSYLQVLDETGAHEGHAGANAAGFGSHFRVRIACPGFAGKRSVACHRLVYDAVQNLIDQGLHALAIEIVDSP
ncbi:MAG: BolA family transcriptional regulator [Polaromonas sp.]|nr:BolA family transcriptional regulator [Polaromonas sp.]